MLFTALLNLVLLIFCWRDGDVSLCTKVVLTLLFLATGAILLWNVGAAVVAQCILAAATGVITFGPGFLNQRIR